MTNSYKIKRFQEEWAKLDAVWEEANQNRDMSRKDKDLAIEVLRLFINILPSMEFEFKAFAPGLSIGVLLADLTKRVNIIVSDDRINVCAEKNGSCIGFTVKNVENVFLYGMLESILNNVI